MARLGDYVQSRIDPAARGEVVRINRDGWATVVSLRDHRWFEEHDKNLTVLVKGTEIG